MGLTGSLRLARVGRHSEAVLGTGEDVLHSYGANQGMVSSCGASVIIDSGFHNKVANGILQRVRASGKRKLFVVDTHYHSDHVFGNNVFARAGAVVIAHENCGLNMRTHSRKLLDDYRRGTRDCQGFFEVSRLLTHQSRTMTGCRFGSERISALR